MSESDELVAFLEPLRRRWRNEVGARVNLVAMGCVDSTQVRARKLLEEHLVVEETPNPFVVIAREQTRGQGRQDRNWSSEAGLGVWATLAWPLDGHPQIETIPLRSAVGLCRTVRRRTGIDCRLKWPNDLLVGTAKLAGLLVDLVCRGDRRYCLIGFGVNVEGVPANLPPGLATSIRASGGMPAVSSIELAPLLVLGVVDELLSSTSWHADYREWLIHRPGDVLTCRIGDEVLEGAFEGIDETGFLWLDTVSGWRAVRSGEVFQW